MEDDFAGANNPSMVHCGSFGDRLALSGLEHGGNTQINGKSVSLPDATMLTNFFGNVSLSVCAVIRGAGRLEQTGKQKETFMTTNRSLRMPYTYARRDGDEA